MRVDKNNTTFAMNSNVVHEQGKKKNTKAIIFGGNLKSALNPIEQKREEAKKQVMKVVGTAFEIRQKLDDEIVMRTKRIDDNRQSIVGLQRELNKLDEEKEALRKSYGVDKDSQEQKDLERMIEQRRRNPNAELGEVTDYQKRSLSIDSAGYHQRKEVEEKQKEVAIDIGVINGIKKGLLKDQSMVKAQTAKGKILDAASKEIVGMLVEDSKEHVDEVMEETKEEAQKKAEEKAKEEEKLEAIKEKNEQMEEIAEGVAPNEESITPVIDSKAITELDQIKMDVDDEIKKILKKLKLIDEDLKGSAVDATI